MTRAAILLVTVVLAAWAFSQLRAEQALERAEAIGGTDPRTAAVRTPQVLADLDAARRGGRRATADLLEGQFLFFTGRSEQAVAVLREHVGRVPEDVNAWRTLATAARREDPGLAAQARSRARELDPLGAP